MRNIHFNYSDKFQTFEDIESFYISAKKALDLRYGGPKTNPNFLIDFTFKTPSEIKEMYESDFMELSFLSSFCILTLVEAKLRIDFIYRTQLKKKDKLSKLYRSQYNPTKRQYTYAYKEVLLDGWKVYRPELESLINRIINATDFRNWVAHGRYWKFRDNIAKYTFEDNLNLARLFFNSIKDDIKDFNDVNLII